MQTGDMKAFLKTLAGLSLLLIALTGFAAERVTYYHNDALGSPVAATDQNGNLLWRETYAPYGERLKEQDGGENNRWYTGKQEEAAYGISYFGARWYDPSIGRFLAIDPVGFNTDNIQSFNRYAYANNNPYKYVDPDGEFAISAALAVVGAVALIYELTSMPEVPFDSGLAMSSSGPGDVVGAAAGLFALKNILGVATKTVGRHMSPDELANMRRTGKVQEGGGGQTRVADPSDPNTFRDPRKGDVFVEFDVPASSVLPHSKGTGRIPGPGSPDARVPGRNPANFKMPPATNIKVPGGG